MTACSVYIIPFECSACHIISHIPSELTYIISNLPCTETVRGSE